MEQKLGCNSVESNCNGNMQCCSPADTLDSSNACKAAMHAMLLHLFCFHSRWTATHALWGFAFHGSHLHSDPPGTSPVCCLFLGQAAGSQAPTVS